MIDPELPDPDEYDFDPVKNEQLIKERGISFDRIIALIKRGKVVQTIRHPNTDRYPNQFIYQVDVDGYIYAVPFVFDGKTAFLKTAYASRKATKKHDQQE